jgi:N6-adenosine-specific RNA methylase IME4
MDYEFHEAANIFPMMEGQGYKDLVSDIAANGLQMPIVLHEEKILDGRNRYRACLELGLLPEFVYYEGDNPFSYVVSLNLKRRHLDESQRAMIAAKLANLKKSDNQFTMVASIDATITQEQAAELLNVSRPSVQRARQVIDHGTPELVQMVERGEVTVSKAVDEIKKEQRMQMQAEMRTRELPEGKYQVIYADPPWEYKNSGFTQSAASIYPTMPIDDICNLKVADLAADSCVLFMWATSPLLPEALKVMEAWGFTYKASRVWVKNRAPGIGWWVHTYHEFLLIGSKGENLHPSEPMHSIITGDVTVHSKKPHSVYADIETNYPGPYIELFARNDRDGWGNWGNEEI